MAPTTDGLKRLRGVLKRFSTPLLPDDYTQLVNPLWSARELRGKIISVTKHTPHTADGEVGAADTVSLVIEPGWGVPTDFEAGQYIGIGVQIGGRYTWRSYSLTCPPNPAGGRLEITVRAVERGKLSNHLVGSARPGMHVRLAAPAGEFHLTNPLPEKLLFVTAGTGITPVISMLRTMEIRGHFNIDNAAGVPDVIHVHSYRTDDDLLFGDDLRDLDAHPNYTLILRRTSTDGRITTEELAQLVGDHDQRVAYACGPSEMLDQLESWSDNLKELKTERFTLDRTSDAQGGTVSFGDRATVTIDGATTLLEAGEDAGIQLPFGCRMGICQTCVRELDDGYVTDLRTGETKGPGERIRTCVSVAAGDCRVNC